MINMYQLNKFANKIYDQDVAGLVSQAFEGVKITVFAYGQTGSGKTFTMMGGGQNPGLYALTVEDIFYKKHKNQRIFVSFYEIYCSQLYDLLNERSKLILREDGNANVNVVGIVQVEVSSPDELIQCIEKGNEERITSATSANYDSSRSHSILQIRIIEDNNEIGKLCFIDLAGNERGADTYDNDKQTRLDGAEINKSLLALKECIRALDQGGKHKPFRGSKLTLVLKDSFIGNCKTMMIANISPSNSCCELTLNTLRYADRVKELSAVKKPGQKKEGNLSDNLMLARKHNQKSPGKEAPESLRQEATPIERPPRPVENKPLHSFQEIEKIGPGIRTNNKPTPKIQKELERIQSHSSKKKKGGTSSSRDVKREPTMLQPKKALDDQAKLMKGDAVAYPNKKLKPISTRPMPPTQLKNNSLLPGKGKAEDFSIIKKFFVKAIESYSKNEIKNVHLQIIDDMILYEEKFLGEHQEYIEKQGRCNKKHKTLIDQIEEPEHEIEPYLKETMKLLDYESELTNSLKSNLIYFRKYMGEETKFAKKYIVENKDRDNKQALGREDFEIVSHDSLLLDE